MPKIKCPNCQKLVPVIPPAYRCNNCNYLLSGNKNNPDAHKPSKGPIASKPYSHSKSKSSGKVSVNLGSNSKSTSSSAPTQVGGLSHGTASKKAFTEVKKIENKNPEKKNKVVAGWLIVHTEDRESATYDLFEGDNYFGTRAEGYKVDIPIEGDKYVSRSHANITVRMDFFNRFHFELKDDGSRRPQGPSLNGTYINGAPERLPKSGSIFLQDGDTIQVGETKLVFKTIQEVENVEEAFTAVMETDYTATVILPKK
jgi:hypothetical protein